MSDLLYPLIYVVMGLGPLVVLGLIGTYAERRHIANLVRREAATTKILATQTRRCMTAAEQSLTPTLIVAEVVIATDYLKQFFAKWRNIFGGEVRSYSTMLERAKREALLRLKEEARQKGYNAICNVRVDSADVGGSALQRRVAMAAVLASCTAYRRR